MHAAQALSIARVERGAAVLTLDDVVGEKPGWRANSAAFAAWSNRLAPVAGSLKHRGAPRMVFGSEQFRIRALCDRLGGPHVHLPVRLTDLLHHHIPLSAFKNGQYPRLRTRMWRLFVNGIEECQMTLTFGYRMQVITFPLRALLLLTTFLNLCFANDPTHVAPS